MSNYLINRRIYSTNVRASNIKRKAVESFNTMLWPGAGLHPAAGYRFVFCACPTKPQRRA